MSKVNKIPSSETKQLKYTTDSGNIYLISNNKIKNKFTLWLEVENNEYQKIASADNPIDLYKKCK